MALCKHVGSQALRATSATYICAMAGSWAHSDYAHQGWEETWPPAPAQWTGKGKKGQAKGKKGKGKWHPQEEDGPEQNFENTNRILSRYQLAHRLLRTSCDTEGSALSKDRTKMNDFAYLAQKHLQQLVSSENHHLLRRPGIGLSEAAGTLQAGSSILQNFGKLSLDSLRDALGTDGVQAALQILNTLDTTAETKRESAVEALTALEDAFRKKPELEEAAIKMTIMASRLYLLGVHLLPLIAGLNNPEWWGTQVPAKASSSKKFQAWKEDPSNRKKMKAALAALLVEKIEEASGAGANDAGALFDRTLGAAAAEDASSDNDKKTKKPKKTKKEEDSSDGDKKAKKTKKAKKEEDKPKTSKRKKRQSTSTSSGSGSASEASAASAKKKKAKKSKKDNKGEDAGSSGSGAHHKKASKKKDKKERKKKQAESVSSDAEVVESSKKPRGRGEALPTIKVRRVSGLTADSKILVKDDDRFDEVEIRSPDWTLQEMLEDLFKASGQEEDIQNWTVKVLEDGKCVPVALDGTPAALHPEVVLIRKGG